MVTAGAVLREGEEGLKAAIWRDRRSVADSPISPRTWMAPVKSGTCHDISSEQAPAQGTATAARRPGDFSFDDPVFQADPWPLYDRKANR